MPDNYARITGAPRSVILGGRAFLVGKLRPVDLGVIQAWMIDQLEHPLEATRRVMADLPEAEQVQLWARAVLEFRDIWPPTLDSEIGANLQASPEGQAVFLWACLRRYQPQLTLADASGMAPLVTAEEYLTLHDRVMPGELGDSCNPDGVATPYGELRIHLCEKYPQYKASDIDLMTIDEIHDLIRGGKTTPPGRSINDESEIGAIESNWRSFWYGL